MKLSTSEPKPGATSGNSIHCDPTEPASNQIIIGIHFCYSHFEEALADLNEALRLAPAGRDVMVSKVLLKAKEDTEAAFRQSQSNEEMETSKTWNYNSPLLGKYP